MKQSGLFGKTAKAAVETRGRPQTRDKRPFGGKAGGEVVEVEGEQVQVDEVVGEVDKPEGEQIQRRKIVKIGSVNRARDKLKTRISELERNQAKLLERLASLEQEVSQLRTGRAGSSSDAGGVGVAGVVGLSEQEGGQGKGQDKEQVQSEQPAGEGAGVYLEPIKPIEQAASASPDEKLESKPIEQAASGSPGKEQEHKPSEEESKQPSNWGHTYPREVFVKAGRGGGRPKMNIFKRKMPFPAYECKNNKSPGLASKVCLGRWMRRVSQEEFEGKQPPQFWDGMVAWIDKSKQWLVEVYTGLDELEIERKRKGMGMGYGKPPVPRGCHGAGVKHVKRGKGIRALGGGPKKFLSALWHGVKAWFNFERQNGMFVDRTDAFSELHDRIKVYHEEMSKRLSDGRMLTKLERDSMRSASVHLCVTNPKHKRYLQNAEQKTKRLMSFIGARLLKPQRLVDIDKNEEKRRLQQTWKLADERVWLCAFGSAEQLGKHVLNPEQFIENRKSIDILQSDQSAVYAMLRPDKQLYAEWEMSTSSKDKSKLSEREKQGGLGGGHGKEQVNNQDQLATEQGPNNVSEQKRGTEHHGQDKMRVTVELVHVIKHWFDPKKEPISCQGKHLVVLCGKHAHADNIDDQHRFVESRRFWVAGKPVLHKAGEKTNLMYNLIELRKQEPEVKAMMDKLHIMQQPSGYVDMVTPQ